MDMATSQWIRFQVNLTHICLSMLQIIQSRRTKYRQPSTIDSSEWSKPSKSRSKKKLQEGPFFLHSFLSWHQSINISYHHRRLEWVLRRCIRSIWIVYQVRSCKYIWSHVSQPSWIQNFPLRIKNHRLRSCFTRYRRQSFKPCLRTLLLPLQQRLPQLFLRYQWKSTLWQ